MILSSIRHEKKNWRNFLVITITNVIKKSYISLFKGKEYTKTFVWIHLWILFKLTTCQNFIGRQIGT